MSYTTLAGIRNL